MTRELADLLSTLLLSVWVIARLVEIRTIVSTVKRSGYFGLEHLGIRKYGELSPYGGRTAFLVRNQKTYRVTALFSVLLALIVYVSSGFMFAIIFSLGTLHNYWLWNWLREQFQYHARLYKEFEEDV